MRKSAARLNPDRLGVRASCLAVMTQLMRDVTDMRVPRYEHVVLPPAARDEEHGDGDEPQLGLAASLQQRPHHKARRLRRQRRQVHDPLYEPLRVVVVALIGPYSIWHLLENGVQLSPSIVTAYNQCAVDMGIFVHRTVEFSLQARRRIPSSPGTKQTQLVSMAPLTTSRLGRTTKARSAMPTACRVSMKKTMRNSLVDGLSLVLKKQMRRERMAVPTSGTAYAKMRHHIQAMRSTSGTSTTNCFSRPAADNNNNNNNNGAAPECRGGEKWEIPEKTHRPAASLDTIPTCENPVVARPGIESPFALVGDEQRGRGGVVVRPLASHLGEPGSIPGGVAPAPSHAGIVPDNTVVVGGSSRRSPVFPMPPIFHTHPTSPSPALKTPMLRAAQNSPFHSSPQDDVAVGQDAVFPQLRRHEERGALGYDAGAEHDDEGDEERHHLEHLDGDLEAALVRHRAAVLRGRRILEHVPSFRLLDSARAATTTTNMPQSVTVTTYGAIQSFAWSDFGKPRKIEIRIAGPGFEPKTSRIRAHSEELHQNLLCIRMENNLRESSSSVASAGIANLAFRTPINLWHRKDEHWSENSSPITGHRVQFPPESTLQFCMWETGQTLPHSSCFRGVLHPLGAFTLKAVHNKVSTFESPAIDLLVRTFRIPPPYDPSKLITGKVMAWYKIEIEDDAAILVLQDCQNGPTCTTNCITQGIPASALVLTPGDTKLTARLCIEFCVLSLFPRHRRSLYVMTFPFTSSLRSRVSLCPQMLLLASHQGEPSSIPGGVATELSYVVIVPDDPAGRQAFSGISSLSRP
ncbi:hypothetical protein PR048_023224 [Dryococelus australis]|uniref:Uncharacterized protein n=1 Tax=Dryococelus australis TaxID=614101 RepID=A0ABQ9GTH3_9NEOP|nr:hypothetical protein PR048_023224 [Dryococelus australis]